MRRSSCLFVPLILLVLYFSRIFISSLFQIANVTEEVNVTAEEVYFNRTYDIFIYSSYLFKDSKSMGKNTIAMVFTADKYMELKSTKFKLTLVSISGKQEKVSTGLIKRVTPHNVCDWIVYEAQFPVIPGTEKIAINTGDKWVELPYSEPVKKKQDVVTCVAPLFANEQWQTAIFASHVYKRFGSFMHVYMRSTVAPLYEVMREYEKMGYMKIQAWQRIVLPNVPEENFNPNINIEFRNQAAAQTDCLLQYKESASFVSFLDLDDILIPRLGSTYFEEFSSLFNSMPNIAYIHYVKENTEAVSRISGKEFSFSEMLSTIKFVQRKETGKMVANPEHVNSTWLHWPVRLGYQMESYNVPNHVNAITHIKTLHRRPGSAQTWLSSPKYNPILGKTLSPDRLISEEDAHALNEDFNKMMSIPAIAKRMPKMPEEFFYHKIIDDCFENTFYKFHYSGQFGLIKCPGPDRCDFPEKPGIMCYNSNATYHAAEGTDYNIYFATNDIFVKEDGCRK